ncbi:hypothetical protein JCGZ_06737 [Jatropha curcas]|uniref:Uncharacterized protein n=1 Tax=Jatropha curcas TaxID=180498 RepID=A0A067J9C6_JATCU|nr:hypothetical protein JCGZ_06737 [Jatropha curcas]
MAWGVPMRTGVLQGKFFLARVRDLHGLGCATLHGRANLARSGRAICWKFKFHLNMCFH